VRERLMPATVRIAILGDRDPANPNHPATENALAHSEAGAGVKVDYAWVSTQDLLSEAGTETLSDFGGVWCTTGALDRPEGALRGIQLARERRIPFLGTCGGFQHAVVEFARNVAGLPEAVHGEYEPDSGDAVIAPLACPLAGQSFEVEIQRGCRAAACYGGTRARERYYCSYGIDPGFEKLLVDRGLPIVGRADDGTPRILELPDHPFFVATLFVPQSRSTVGAPHPLVTGFLRAAREGQA